MWAKWLGTVAAFSVLTVLGLAGQGNEKAAGKKTAKGGGQGIEGSWLATGANVGGKKIPDEQVSKVHLLAVFKDGQFTAEYGGKQFDAGTYKVIGKDKVELTHTEGKQKGKVEKGLFKVEGDTLTTVFPAGDSKAEPKGFEPAETSEVTTFKRDTGAAKDKPAEVEKKPATKKAEKKK
jgi:uncharacterized protein (TIGR03067 family)